MPIKQNISNPAFNPNDPNQPVNQADLVTRARAVGLPDNSNEADIAAAEKTRGINYPAGYPNQPGYPSGTQSGTQYPNQPGNPGYQTGNPTGYSNQPGDTRYPNQQGNLTGNSSYQNQPGYQNTPGYPQGVRNISRLTREEVKLHNEKVNDELAAYNAINNNANTVNYVELSEAIDQLNKNIDSSNPQTPLALATKRVNEAFRTFKS